MRDFWEKYCSEVEAVCVSVCVCVTYKIVKRLVNVPHCQPAVSVTALNQSAKGLKSSIGINWSARVKATRRDTLTDKINVKMHFMLKTTVIPWFSPISNFSTSHFSASQTPAFRKKRFEVTPVSH